KARFFGIAVSALLSIASVVLFIHPGLNYGVDFRGGIQMAVRTTGPADLGTFRECLNTLGLGEISLQSVPLRRLPAVERERECCSC
ncbi:hypothetical protein ACCT04_35665, partial [Rhizobium ruizarguesonis]